MRRKRIICFILVTVTFAVYWPVRNHDFIFFDDPQFVSENPAIQAGLTWENVLWAFQNPVVANWHPVTTLSHMLDCQLFEVRAGAHHLVSAALHAVNALLLFLALHRLTGALGRSAVVAALFALHPLRVESVAWIAERKDVMSGLFMMLTLWAYAGYARAAAGGPDRRLGKYLLVLGFCALGLMSKPMLVTLPCVLLLLDFWPLRRWTLPADAALNRANAAPSTSDGLKPGHPTRTLSGLWPLVIEKIPLFLFAAALCWVTLYLQKGAIRMTAAIPLTDRLSNAIASYGKYLGKTLWPAGLAVLYPHPGGHYDAAASTFAWGGLWIAAVLLAITGLCLWTLRSKPYLAVGWFWYLGMMVPVIGLVQVGEQAMADRYTYLPLIGPALSLVWLLCDLWPAGRLRSYLLGALASVSLGACVLLTHRQLQYWRNTVTLFEHTLAVTGPNPAAEFSLGAGLERAGRLGEALVHYRAAVALAPDYHEPRYNLGQIFGQRGDWQAAATEYQAVLRVRPNDLNSQLNLASVVQRLGRTREAIALFEQALRLDPVCTEALNNLAWILATSADGSLRDGPRAVELARRACELTRYQTTVMVGTLAAAYAAADRFPEAVATAQRACDLAAAADDQALLKRNRELLELYRTGRPHREPSP